MTIIPQSKATQMASGVMALILVLTGCYQPVQPSQPVPAKPITASTEQFQAVLYVKDPPLTIGEETLNIEVTERQSHEPVADTPVFKAILILPNMTAEAPMEVTQLPVPGEYELRPVFTMAGHWLIQVQPTGNQPSLEIPVLVSEAAGETGAE